MSKYLNAGEFHPVRLADIIVPAYQRDGGERSAVSVEKNFNPELLQALTVAETAETECEEDDRFLIPDDRHRTGKRYLLVDGLQRCTGLAAVYPDGDAEVMAQVLEDVARDRQVNLFVGLNRGSVRVKDYWIYRAKRNSGHPGILAIDKTLADLGFKIAARVEKGSRATIPAVAPLTNFCGVSLVSSERRDADEDSLRALGDALYTINALWPADLDSSAQRNNATVLFGLASLFRDSRSRGGKTLERDYVIEKVRSYSEQLVVPVNLIAEGNKLKVKDNAGLISSSGSHSFQRFVIQAWLSIINKGRGSKFSIPPRSDVSSDAL